MKIRIIIAIFAVVWISLLVRVYYLSIKSNNYYEELSSKNTLKKELIAPVRGEILDRKQRPIAINKMGFKIQIQPHLSRKSKLPLLEDELQNIVVQLPFLEYDKLLKRYIDGDSSYNHDPIDIVDFVSFEEMIPVYSRLVLRENVNIVHAPRRYYPNGKIAAHVIGYVGRVNQKELENDPLLQLTGSVGKSGIEKYYNDVLEGIAGERVIQVSAYNEQISEISYTPPKENRNVLLSIDMELQRFIAEMFEKQVGSVVVMDTEGAIYAAGSYPEYNLNTFVTGITQDKWQALIDDIDTPFTNKIINGLYPPGSIIKTGLGLGYATHGLSEWWSVDCNGTFMLGKRKFRCWKHSGHGKTNLNKAIRESCDDYFYKGSLKLGIEVMSDILKRYGLGKKTGVDLPNEFIGTVPSREWKRERHNQPWYRGETLNTSIGQGNFLTTPLQIAQFTALMATGKLPVPHIADTIAGERYEHNASDVLNDEEKKKLPYVQRAMYEVCNHPKGTARNYMRTNIKVAGKTGTAQVVGISQETKKRLKEHEMEYYKRSHAWLTTYAPYDNPQFIVTVLVEHGGHGGAAAGEIVSKIYNKLVSLGYMKP